MSSPSVPGSLRLALGVALLLTAGAASAATPNISATFGSFGTEPAVSVTGKNFSHGKNVIIETYENGVFSNASRQDTVKATGGGKISDILILPVSPACFVDVVAKDVKTGKLSNTVRTQKPGCVGPTVEASLEQLANSTEPGVFLSVRGMTPFEAFDLTVSLDTIDGEILAEQFPVADGDGNYLDRGIPLLGKKACGHKVVVAAQDEVTGVEAPPVTVQTHTCPP